MTSMMSRAFSHIIWVTVLLQVTLVTAFGPISISGTDNLFSALSHQHRSVCYPAAELEGGLITEKSPCCGTCSYEPDCVKYGSCCLGAYENFTHGQASIKGTRYSCARAQYLQPEESDYNTDNFYWMISYCDRTKSTNIAYRIHCENPVLEGFEDTRDRITPVTNLQTGHHYRNKFCAYCNGVDERASLVNWKLSVESDHFVSMFSEDFIKLLKEVRGNIMYIQPEYVSVTECNVPPYKISSCNQTGLWRLYKSYIETACRSFIDPFNSTFKNYFCYLCNVLEPESIDNFSCPFIMFQDVKISILPPFFAILDASVVRTERHRDRIFCDPKQFLDEMTMTCRDVLCHGERNLKNGECSNFYNRDMLTKCMAIFFKLTPKTNGIPAYDIGSGAHFNKTVYNFISDRIVRNNLISNKLIIFYHYANPPIALKYAVVLLMVQASADLERGIFSKYMDSVYALRDAVMTLVPNPKKAESSYPLVFEAAVYNFSFSFLENTARMYLTNMLNEHIQELSTRVQDVGSYTCLRENMTVLNQLTFCPFIDVSIYNLSYRIENGYLNVDGYCGHNITEKYTSGVFSRWQYEVHGDSIRLCFEDFLKIYNSVTKPIPLSVEPLFADNIDPKSILSFCCVCLSIVCLLVTIVTYCSLTALQSSPGVNNLILSIFLLLAQTMYQFGAGQTSVSPLACAIIGAICHFLWLCTVFSMNMCSIQMFIIFKKQLRITSRFDTLQTLRYILYVTCASLLFVSINLIVSLVRSKGEESGYGGHICYISSSLMQTITFVVPSAVTIITNLVLFSYVVYKIRKIGLVTVRLNKQRNYLGVYARLSTLIGITWTFGYLRVLIDLEALEYLFIIFNASQGVFIMIAFVINRRVFAMICPNKASPSIATLSESLSTRPESLKSS